MTIGAELVKTATEELGLYDATLVADVTAVVVETLSTTLLEGAAEAEAAATLELLDGPRQVKSSRERVLHSNWSNWSAVVRSAAVQLA